jgi:hypothetical protein
VALVDTLSLSLTLTLTLALTVSMILTYYLMGILNLIVYVIQFLVNM